ncbi:hypothetical protein [Streptomyces sp. NPDC017941]|uniref:hypothetical protein n=1 Tax=Streptomyces sp. NPDC017941 TaxID=3365018 RepID=UPI00379223AE
MTNAAVIALITALATLGGAALAGWFALQASRGQIRHQEQLAALQRIASRREQQHSARKGAYEQFIHQAVQVSQANGDMVQPDAQDDTDTYDEALGRARAAFKELWPLLALVSVEGPHYAAQSAEQLTNALKAEHTKARRTHHSPDLLPEFVEASRERQACQWDFVAAARRVVEDFVQFPQ